ncbi:aspartate/glutamate racemase family protein [Pedobacter nyackensis]|uniref:aspartate/glutamate racemase family protein n=1 Tax=Pedobacter nyackensis TaxID=475255 RepID=UPI00292FEE84|nr:aspartate/glutamate racemase family protein [Pedobacter nyackensis]
MKTKTLGLVHTSATLVPVFQKLCSDYLPGVNVFNIVDDSLIKDVINRNELTKLTSRRVVDHVASAETAGADFILVTCSSIGSAIETAAGLTGVPVLRVDQPMADLAVKTGKKIGVIATLPTTLGPTSDLVKRRAAVAGKEIELTSILCEGAFEALMGGEPEKHDEMVAKALVELSAKVEVIVLAQASMSRVVDGLPEAEKRVPILASPALAIQHIADLFK